MVTLAVTMLVLISGVALGAFGLGSDGGETLSCTLKADTASGYGGGDDLLRGNPGHERVYLDDNDRYTTDCEMVTPVGQHPRSERVGAG